MIGIKPPAGHVRPAPPVRARSDADHHSPPSGGGETTLSQRDGTTRTSYHGSGAVSFSTKGEYGVRLMVQLGRRYGDGPVSLAEIAAVEDLPRPYLEQLVMPLRDAGLVVSRRGARGGYELARPPADISMSDVLRALEGPIAPMVCATDEDQHRPGCDRSSHCTVNVLWVRVRDAIVATLDSMTLADLVPMRVPVPDASVALPIHQPGAREPVGV